MKNTTTASEIFKNIDLYNSEILFTFLKNKFTHVSYTRTRLTPAKEGSPCIELKYISFNPSFKIIKLIEHKTGQITIKTSKNHFYTFLII
jgi:hypothetical protein